MDEEMDEVRLLSPEIEQLDSSTENGHGMNLMENSPGSSSSGIDPDVTWENLDQNTRKMDIYLCTVYWRSVEKLLNTSGDRSNIPYFKRYLRLFFDCYLEFRMYPGRRHIYEEDVDLRNLMMDTLYYRITCIYLNGAVYSSAVAFHLQNVLMNNSSLCERLLQRKVINICSLACGPASDVVAVMFVLDSMAKKNGVDLDFRVTVIDLDKQWKNTCMTILSCLEQFRNTTWKIRFVTEDLPESLSSNSIEAIQNADIVTFVKILPTLNVQEKGLKNKAVIDASKFIQPGALFLFLGFSDIPLIQSCGGCLGSLTNFKLVYEELNDLHALHTGARELSLKHWTEFLGLKLSSKDIQFALNNHFKVFVRVWVRSPSSKHKETSRKLEFRQNRENYTVKQSFLDKNSFQNWERNFCNNQLLLGWMPKGIKKVVQSREDTRKASLTQWNDRKKLVASARKQLVHTYSQEVDENSNQVYEDAWIRYHTEKEALTILKNEICRHSNYHIPPFGNTRYS